MQRAFVASLSRELGTGSLSGTLSPLRMLGMMKMEGILTFVIRASLLIYLMTGIKMLMGG